LRGHETYNRSAIEAKLKLAEEVLDYSNHNIQLTIEIFLTQAANDIAPLLAQRVENSAKISTLIQQIREHVDTEKEQELLDSASTQWAWAYDYHQNPYPLPPINGRKLVMPRTAMLNVMLPLLLDNHSWKVFIEFLRAQMELAGVDGELKQEMADWTQDFVNTSQKLKSRVAELGRMEELLSQFSSIIEFSSDAIVTHALDGTIVSWNRAAEDIYGYSASEVLGRSRKLLVPPDLPDDLAATLETLKRGERLESRETTHLRKDRQRIDLSITTSPVKDADGQIVGVATISRQISHGKEKVGEMLNGQEMLN
jgi:PAS domain S-box-containing protein